MNIISPQGLKIIDDIDVRNTGLAPFSNVLVEFVNDVSQEILNDTGAQSFPEMVTLAFWMRRGHINQLQDMFFQQNKDKLLFPRGVVFHLPPSNVDTIFVYSWFLSLLVGNCNILRISDNCNHQVLYLLSIISTVLAKNKYAIIQSSNFIIQYAHNSDITKKLSLLADIRVIWGGDKTIEKIREFPIKATATELTFADKFSFALIKSSALIDNDEIDKFITSFYNDAFWFGQMACSSIRLIVWVGTAKEISRAQHILWDKLEARTLKNKPDNIEAADIVNKLVAECSLAIEENIHIIKTNSPYINRIKLTDFKNINDNLHCGAGLFYELEAKSLPAIFSNITKKIQTISYYGFNNEQLQDVLLETQPVGIDRIVPIGKSLEFSHIWDGYDLFQSFCRQIEICK